MRRVLEKPMKHAPWQAVSNRTNTYPIFDAPNCIDCMRRVLEKPMKHTQKADKVRPIDDKRAFLDKKCVLGNFF